MRTGGPARSSLPRYAVIVSRFPKLTETFIVRELDGLEAQGLPLELFTIVREREPVVQPAARAWVRRLHGRPAVRALFCDQLYWLRCTPRAYGRAWWRALWGNRRSPRFLARSVFLVPLAASYARTMRRLAIDRVHAHWATHPALLALLIRTLSGIPFSFTGHAHDLYADRTMLCEKAGAADLVVTCSADGRRVLVEECGAGAEAESEVVHHGIDLDRFSAAPIGTSADAVLRILCVASLQEYKGHRYLLEALRRLLTDGVSAELTLVGDGEERRAIESAIERLRIQESVRLAGRLTEDQVRAAYRAHDVVALASIEIGTGKRDGIPNVLVEAMATARPVVASDLPAVRELVVDGETGLLVPPRDAAALATALARMRDAELRREWGRAGRMVVERSFDARRNVRRLFELLTALPVADAPDAPAAAG